MRCPEPGCGKLIPPGAANCPNCGRAVPPQDSRAGKAPVMEGPIVNRGEVDASSTATADDHSVRDDHSSRDSSIHDHSVDSHDDHRSTSVSETQVDDHSDSSQKVVQSVDNSVTETVGRDKVVLQHGGHGHGFMVFALALAALAIVALVVVAFMGVLARNGGTGGPSDEELAGVDRAAPEGSGAPRVDGADRAEAEAGHSEATEDEHAGQGAAAEGGGPPSEADEDRPASPAPAPVTTGAATPSTPRASTGTPKQGSGQRRPNPAEGGETTRPPRDLTRVPGLPGTQPGGGASSGGNTPKPLERVPGLPSTQPTDDSE